MGCGCGATRLSTAVLLTGLAAGVSMLATGAAWGPDHDPEQARDAEMKIEAAERAAREADPAYVLKYEMKSIEGTPVKLEQYRGKVVLIVNVASACGLTPQYEGLEALYRKHKDEGLVVLGFPANNFNGQEPGTNEQIATFCTEKFDVTFPMFSKISVKGEDRHPLYAQLAKLPEPLGGEPTWNFTKFLVNRDGRVVARFDPRTKPNDEKFVAAVERLLEAEAAEAGAAGSGQDAAGG